MTWKHRFWIIANLDNEFPGWRENFMCEGGHKLFDNFQELIDVLKSDNSLPMSVKNGHIGRSFYSNAPLGTEDVKFLCMRHWMERNPSSFLLAHAGMVGRCRSNKERMDIVRKAFTYANTHGYDAAHKYLSTFKMREI